jgi:tetratricopeptide (TPR) repeat protein
LDKLDFLAESRDWRGVVAMGRQVGAVAEAVRATDPSMATFGYTILGVAYRSLGDFAKAVECHTQALAIAKEVGDRAGESGAYVNLGNVYLLLGDVEKATEYHTRARALSLSLSR